MSLQEFRDELSKSAHGMTRDEAHAKGVCVDCKLPIHGRLKNEVDAREYQISGVCGPCWEQMFQGDEL